MAAHPEGQHQSLSLQPVMKEPCEADDHESNMPSPVLSGLEVSHMFRPHPRGEAYTRGHLGVCPPQRVTQCHWEFDGASLFPAEDRCPVQSDLGEREREAGGRQPSGRTEAEELGGGVCSQLRPRPRLQAPCRLAPQPASGLVQPMGSSDKYSEGRKPGEAGTFHPLGHGGRVPTGAASPSRLQISPPPSLLPRSFLPRSRHLSKGPALSFVPVSLRPQGLPVPGLPRSPLLAFLVLLSSAQSVLCIYFVRNP